MDAASLPAGISERLRREAERPMYWIKVHGEADKPEPRRAAPAPVRGEPVKPEPVRAEPVRAEAPKSEPAKAAAIARSTPATPAPATASPVAPPEATPAPVAQSTPELPTPAQQTRSPGPLADNAPAPELAPPALTQAAVPENAASQEGKGDTQLASAAPSLPPPPRPDIKPPVAEALELLSSSQPQFPQALMRQLRKGELQVEVDVSTDGTVADARVLSSSHPRLESAALSAIRTWQFKPPARPTSAVINFSFDLDS
jgi:TonB family protein